MNVLIIANHTSRELAPLINDSALCLLTVAGKPIIEHTLEAVARFSPSSTTIVASRGLQSVRNYIGSGERWGLVIDVVSSRPNESLIRLKNNNPRLFLDDLLIIECNRIRGFAYTYFMQEVTNSDIVANQFTAFADGKNAGLHFLAKAGNLNSEVSIGINIPDAQTYEITDLQAYHKVNMLVAANEIPTILTRGKERSLGLTTGFMTRIHPRSLKSGRVHAGNNCRVHASCHLSGHVVLNNGVIIDKNTSIQDSLILSNTFVGENLEIKNAILSGDLLIRVDTGAVVEVTDKFLTAKLGESIYDAHFADITNRVFGVALLILSLPLWPLALMLAFLSSPNNMVESKQYFGNKNNRRNSGKRLFNTFEFSVSHGLLRRLPLVVAIVVGHIRLVGISLFTPEELTDRTDGWETARDNDSIGALGPVQLFMADNTDIDEKILTDTIFAQQSSKMNSLITCWQAIRLLFRVETELPSGGLGSSISE